MKVIVAGVSKTGTKSMNAALSTLGFKVYDFPENASLLCDEYSRIVHVGWTTDDFRRMYENVDAVVDFPAYFFWNEIHKAFPHSKIILTMRDNEEQWLQSYEKQNEAEEGILILALMKFMSPTGRKIMDFAAKLAVLTFGTPKSTFKNTKVNGCLAKKLYRAHNAYVMQTAPKDKLLVFKCTEGWEPLCKFLGVPIPHGPFPHENKGASLTQNPHNLPLFQKVKKEVYLNSMILAATAAAITVGIYKYRFL